MFKLNIVYKDLIISTIVDTYGNKNKNCCCL